MCIRLSVHSSFRIQLVVGLVPEWSSCLKLEHLWLLRRASELESESAILVYVLFQIDPWTIQEIQGLYLSDRNILHGHQQQPQKVDLCLLVEREALLEEQTQSMTSQLHSSQVSRGAWTINDQVMGRTQDSGMLIYQDEDPFPNLVSETGQEYLHQLSLQQLLEKLQNMVELYGHRSIDLALVP